MNMNWKNRQAGWKQQKGMTLMELLVAGTISIIASSGMIILMGSTLGTATRTIEMTGLSEQMRTSMQIMTREMRRANYHSTHAVCFGDVDCRATLGIADVVKTITIDGGSGGSCVYFWYDRPDATATAVTGEQVAAFRRTTNAAGTGLIEMSVSGTAAPDCGGTDASWQAITDPNIYDITNFAVTSDESYTLSINSVGANLAVDRIGITMTGKMAVDPSLPGWMTDAGSSLTLVDFIRVRNDISSPL